MIEIIMLHKLMLKCKDLEGREECEVNVLDSICVMKFSEVIALGRENPVDILKKKYVDQLWPHVADYFLVHV